ncbi:MAG: Lrp/AsnC family transcriptional regulator [Absicoccus sp.]|uniref:Lrp/AsnC family transcriptional regulator n=1 Tax=Absicoccus intestinalis TaxID=2926319 RepID=A0ABU4WL16_9FIRM|nr:MULTISPECIES: Lrp/AsnC family transcriptional regulator [unclassified Absicoccus]MDX8417227.1 Lrp/AsnC family transcriptional regulator [Absicoccus sp. CLA-KB-P134]MDY3036280.1 Lrp/AsnC family transcriptional regulator [Absicoccus sp.]
MAKNLDGIDRKILNILQKDARSSIKEIAQQVFLSSPAVLVRIKRLEEEGYIEGYHAQLNMEQLGMNIKAFIKVNLQAKYRSEFLAYIESETNVVSSYTITGDYAYLLEVIYDSMKQLDAFIQNLQIYGQTKTDIVFLTSFENRSLEFAEEK